MLRRFIEFSMPDVWIHGISSSVLNKLSPNSTFGLCICPWFDAYMHIVYYSNSKFYSCHKNWTKKKLLPIIIFFLTFYISNKISLLFSCVNTSIIDLDQFWFVNSTNYILFVISHFQYLQFAHHMEWTCLNNPIILC